MRPRGQRARSRDDAAAIGAPLRAARGPVPRPRSAFYLLITSAMSCTVFLGFSFTYFGPLARGAYPDVSPLVHIHGWTFFAWYMLLPLQAGLIRSRKVAIHRTLGLASIGLGTIMILAGLVVSVVQIDLARAPDGDPFWQLMGVPIFGAWILFTFLYVEAIRRRRRVDDHKRLILLASAVALSSATFRIVVRIAGFGVWVAIIGVLAAVVFPLLAMIHDRRNRTAIHPVHAWGVPTMVAMTLGTFLLGVTPGGDLLEQGLARVGRVLRPLYASGVQPRDRGSVGSWIVPLSVHQVSLGWPIQSPRPNPHRIGEAMLETEITTGALVVHPGKPEFGPGKVAHVRGQMLHVFFRDRPDRRALKFNRESLRPADVQNDPVLDNLPPCLEKAGAFWLPADRMTLLMARERFLGFFPGGFSDPEYLGQSANERKYKWEAHERLAGVFGDERARAMLGDGRAVELAGEALRALGDAANLLAKTEAIALTEGLRNDAAAERFFSTLMDLVETGPVEPAFTAHAEAAASLPVKGTTHTAKWPVVTVFAYLLRPDTFMFVKPDSTKAAAAALAFDIRYDTTPNWNTYERVHHMAQIYMHQLADMGPRDFIDIQSFFWVTGGTYAATLAKQAKKKRPKTV